jgi:L-ascorbate metabolism protein UlaG (beta-lactamase superfamily)
MLLQLLRHATLLIELNGKSLLIDPMLSDKEAMPPIVNSSNDRRNPLVELVVPNNYLDKIDAIVLTHTHRDHFDDAAAQKLPKRKPVLCQPEDEAKLQKIGFENVIPIGNRIHWEGIDIIRTGGQHGAGEIGQMMNPVSGYVLQTSNEPLLYIAGDTIYCQEVETALATHRPEITVLNGGGARFKVGAPITMTPEDVEQVLTFAPETKVVVVHLEAINHCLVTRDDFRYVLNNKKWTDRVLIPYDGEILEF